MEEKGFMYNPGGHILSREWQDIPCQRISCVANTYGKCAVPSRCVIGEDGKCEGYIIGYDIKKEGVKS